EIRRAGAGLRCRHLVGSEVGPAGRGDAADIAGGNVRNGTGPDLLHAVAGELVGVGGRAVGRAVPGAVIGDAADSAIGAGRVFDPAQAVVLESLVVGGRYMVGDAGDVVVRVIAIAQVLDVRCARVVGDARHPVILVKGPGVGDAVAVGPRGRGA